MVRTLAQSTYLVFYPEDVLMQLDEDSGWTKGRLVSRGAQAVAAGLTNVGIEGWYPGAFTRPV